MSLVQHFGDVKSPIWIITSEPYDKDQNYGYLFSSGYGYNWKKIWALSGIKETPHLRSVRPCIGASYDNQTSLYKLLNDLDQYKPTFIVPLTDEVLNYLVPYTQQIKEKNSSLRKWAGSILTCEFLHHPHYIIGTHPPDYFTINWDEHEIGAFIHLGHLKDEYEYWLANGVLNPLPKRTLVVNPNYGDLLGLLNETLTKKIIADDIETIRPKKDSYYHLLKHPGYPYVNGIAWSALFGFSYSYWDYTPEQCTKIWRLTDKILSTVPQVGQNYFTFDSHYHERQGFRVCLDKCKDTMIRHHILWPGLPHSLQFQTLQYTREPFYKDEGKGFKLAFKEKYMTYNCKDATVTFEIYEKQEEEFNDRPYLR